MKIEDCIEGRKVKVNGNFNDTMTPGSWGFIKEKYSGSARIEFHKLTCDFEHRMPYTLPVCGDVPYKHLEPYTIVVDSKIKSIGKILKSGLYLPENYSVELIKENDIDRIEGFRKSVVPKPFRKNGIFTEDDIVGYYALNGKLAGTVAVGIKNDSATIKFLYALPSDPNRAKIQDHLANLAMLEAYSRGFDKIFFESWDGDSSLRLLEKGGFSEIRRKESFYSNKETKRILVKKIDKTIKDYFNK